MLWYSIRSTLQASKTEKSLEISECNQATRMAHQDGNATSLTVNGLEEVVAVVNEGSEAADTAEGAHGFVMAL